MTLHLKRPPIKDHVVALRLTARDSVALERLARDEDMKLSEYCRWVLRTHLKKLGTGRAPLHGKAT